MEEESAGICVVSS